MSTDKKNEREPKLDSDQELTDDELDSVAGGVGFNRDSIVKATPMAPHAGTALVGGLPGIDGELIKFDGIKGE